MFYDDIVVTEYVSRNVNNRIINDERTCEKWKSSLQIHFLLNMMEKCGACSYDTCSTNFIYIYNIYKLLIPMRNEKYKKIIKR